VANMVDKRSARSLSVLDLFSGAGGMSYGFLVRGHRVIGAVDAEQSKPCEGMGVLDCNATYSANIGVQPWSIDLARTSARDLLRVVSTRTSIRTGEIDVLIACPPCTDLSRAKPTNHLVDGERNYLVSKIADFVRVLRPRFLVLENARELIMGRQSHHFDHLRDHLNRLGYVIRADIYFFHEFGLPQIRERAVMLAARDQGWMPDLRNLWEGWRVSPEAITVRRAIGHLPPIAAGEKNPMDPLHQAPGFASDIARRRIAAIPHNGGSWFDLASHPDRDILLTPSMKTRFSQGDLGSYPDVYGRMAWDEPAKTIKRECAHVGNGRYAHPEQDRLMTVREASLLQGFPRRYRFMSRSLSNCYRHIGDAVPPLIAFQLGALIEWAISGKRPDPEEFVLEGTCLKVEDVVKNVADAAGA
jgi:DNA (cytosine-5)-methyltransferase 1